jgi:hypothetical protein
LDALMRLQLPSGVDIEIKPWAAAFFASGSVRRPVPQYSGIGILDSWY